MKNLLLSASLGLFLACTADDSTGPSGQSALLDTMPKGSASGVQWVEMGGVKIATRNASDSATWEQAKGMCKDGWRLPIITDLDSLNLVSYYISLKLTDTAINVTYGIPTTKEDSIKLKKFKDFENKIYREQRAKEIILESLGMKPGTSYFGYDSSSDYRKFSPEKIKGPKAAVRCIYEPDSTRLKAYLATKCTGPRC